MALRLGLCCVFRDYPIKFRTTTVAFVLRKFSEVSERETFFSEIILHNLKALEEAIIYCGSHGIGCFRIYSQLFPLYTFSQCAYRVENLPQAREILAQLKVCCQKAKQLNIRLTFHPDQFVVLNSPNPLVVENSLKELEYHGWLAENLGADMINIHAGGSYGDKVKALKTLGNHLQRLSPIVLKRLTLENDDKSFSPTDLIPFCLKHHLPFVYDVHHHRCLSDTYSIERATEEALKTWNREPLFHLSSPLEGWKGTKPERHHDYIDIKDFPLCWKTSFPLTVEIEAKAKELAVLKFQKDLSNLF